MNWNYQFLMNRKKYIAFIGLVMLLFTAGLSHTNAETANALEPLQTFEEFFQSADIEVSEWQILMREHVVISNDTDPKSFIEQFMPNATVQMEETEHSIKYFTENLHKSPTIREQISIVQDKANRESLQLFYVIKGNQKVSQVKSFVMSNINRANSQYFTKNPSIFTCMKAKSNAIIKSKFVIDKFQDFTDMEVKNLLNESNFTTVSGFINDLHVEAIPISKTENMNVQLAVRKVAEEGTTITLGTPILTVEY